MVRRLTLALGLAFSVTACGGGGGVLAPAPQNPGTTPQSAYVTPTFMLGFHVGGKAAARGAHPDFIGAAAASVKITLTSNTAGVTGMPSATTALTTGGGGNCTVSGGTETCTVNGPPVPPGMDTFDVVVSDGTSRAIAQSTSSAQPVTTDQPVTVTAGTNANISITLFGVPAQMAITQPTSVSANDGSSPTPGSPAKQALTVSVADADGDAISGQFSQPVTLTSSDSGSGSQGVQLACTDAGSACTTAAKTATFNNSGLAGSQPGQGDIATAQLQFGGLHEANPTIAAATGGVTNGTATLLIVQQALTLVSNPVSNSGGNPPAELDLYNTTSGQQGNSGTFTATENGFTNAPYSMTTVATPGACTNAATFANVFTLGAGNAFTATVGATPSSTSCSVAVSDGVAGTASSATETLTYTAGGFTIK